MKHVRYSFDIDLGGSDEGLEGRGRWYGWDNIQVEGNDLEECLDQSYVFTVDQDGGEGPQFTFEDMPDWKV